MTNSVRPNCAIRHKSPLVPPARGFGWLGYTVGHSDGNHVGWDEMLKISALVLSFVGVAPLAI